MKSKKPLTPQDRINRLRTIAGNLDHQATLAAQRNSNVVAGELRLEAQELREKADRLQQEEDQ